MKKTYLKDVAYQKLKEKILTGHYSDKNHTSENELVEEFEMSRTPIREALQRLQAEGLLKIYSNQGVFFHSPSLKETHDLFEMRMAIEMFAIRKAAQLITKQNIVELEENLALQREAIDEEDTYTYLQHDMQFHRSLVGISDNDMFVQTMINIRERMFYQAYTILKKNPARMLLSHEEHIAILNALRTGNAKNVIKQMDVHFEKGRIELFTP
ncbi:GntR family transcriptional regulator [Brevibacillus centrosporus]|jgi:DNA-binding GntR family transcriptional regulator|nr:GntR family transcriptional regulator [Brevibacillus centrosporus]